jgi:hypothetical protein
VITTQEAQPYTYYGASTAWQRAVKRAGVHNCHFNDLHAKALTDKETAAGMQQARRKGAHSTEAQTADYVRHREGGEDGGDTISGDQQREARLTLSGRIWWRYVSRFGVTYLSPARFEELHGAPV